MQRRLIRGLLFGGIAGLSASMPLLAAELPSLTLDLNQVTVSGISSGAYMAVQFGVAHSAAVSGVAATAGGPYYCSGGVVLNALMNCMARELPFSKPELDAMRATAVALASSRQIDPLENLKRQRIWSFHGSEDTLVKKAVSDALLLWYDGAVPATQRFYQDTLPAGHAQISASCPQKDSAVCNPCGITGGRYINRCYVDASPYDAAGSALQFFYGPLVRTASDKLKGQLLEFDQKPYMPQKKGSAINPARISMAKTGYIYVPADCTTGQTCRIHVVFHGCEQYAGLVGTDFVKYSGVNEWADASRIVVLYPQTIKSTASLLNPKLPINPKGCWDWWGYNDESLANAGRFATSKAPQIDAVWRMVQQLAGQGNKPVQAAVAREALVKIIDHTPTQTMLAWQHLENAAGYLVYREEQEKWLLLTAQPVPGPAFVDHHPEAKARYRYRVRAIDNAGGEIASFESVEATMTAPASSVVQKKQ